MNREILTKLADVLICAEKTPFTFDCEVKFNGIYGTDRVTMCYCTEDEYDKIVSDYAFDETIFFYIIVADNALKDTLNNSDWSIIDVYEDSVSPINL